MKYLLTLVSLFLIGCGGGKDYHSLSKFDNMCDSYEMQICGDDTNYMNEIGVDSVQTLEIFYEYKLDVGDVYQPVREDSGSFVGDCEDIALSVAEVLYSKAWVLKIEFMAGERNGEGHSWLKVTTTNGSYRYDVGGKSSDVYFIHEVIVLKDES